MNEKEIEKITEIVETALEQSGVTVHIPTKNLFALFGTIIVGNVATVLLMQGITRYAKKYVIVKEEDKEIKDEDIFTYDRPIDIKPPNNDD